MDVESNDQESLLANEEPDKAAEDNASEMAQERERISFSGIIKKFQYLFWIIVVIGVVIAALLLILTDKGDHAMFGCRILATFGASLMFCSSIRMIWIFFRRHVYEQAEKRMPLMFGFFIVFMSLIALYGYYTKCTKLRIFWNFDFVLHYKYQMPEMAMDILYIFSVLVFLFLLPLYLFFVARIYKISSFDYWFFCTTLFINALQKLVFETIIVHMEMCEELIKEDKMCEKFIEYHTSTKNLSHLQKELYYSIKDNEALTYTVTMELFIACIGLIVFFGHNAHQHEVLEQKETPVEPKIIFTKLMVILIFIILLISPLYIIYVIQVIAVTKQNFAIRCSQIFVRLIVHFSNLVLIVYCTFFIYKLKPYPRHWPSEPDIVILWIAWDVSAFKFLLKVFVQLYYLWNTVHGLDFAALIIAQIGNTFENLAFYFLIFLVEHFLLIAENSGHQNAENYLSKFTLTFLPLYFCFCLIGFTAYFISNTFHYLPENVEDPKGLNLLVLFQSSYPTTMLFTMTLCLSFAYVMEKVYQNNYYRFN